ncbi:hypothetical protein [Lacinutrix jangbogonensis]|uniref:hypothetical protein n=1 Tax=Lacinutrix jangbogonensis TaxID=1469557 RepID=UPI00053DAABD|nr:hypothetical protein [Lacinutrix jangbogonensis]
MNTRTDVIGALSNGFPLLKVKSIMVIYLHIKAVGYYVKDSDSFLFGVVHSNQIKVLKGSVLNAI